MNEDAKGKVMMQRFAHEARGAKCVVRRANWYWGSFIPVYALRHPIVVHVHSQNEDNVENDSSPVSG